MKKLLLFAICISFQLSYGQLPPNSFGEDITLTDINGNEFNLYSALDDGKTVILDLFATWCGPCWSFAEAGTLEQLQDAYPDEVLCVAIEADPSTAASEIYNSALGDWTSIINYTMADDPSGDVASDYALAFYPTIYKICPDRMVTEVGQLSTVNAYYSEVGSCSSASYNRDVKMLPFNGANAHCNGSASPTVRVQNYSLDTDVTSFTIVASQGGNVLSETEWSGNLSIYQTTEVTINEISGLSGNANINFEVQFEGDQDGSNNSTSATLSGVSQQSSPNVTLHIETDGWGYETSFTLSDLAGNTVESVDGSLENLSTYDWEWDLDEGCYVFSIQDSYGDGFAGAQWGSVDGVGTLECTNTGVLWSDVDFGDNASIVFEVVNALNIDEDKNSNINIYPNPSSSKDINIFIQSTSTMNTNITIYNNLGKAIYSSKHNISIGSNNINVNLDKIASGLYYVNTVIDGENHIEPLMIK